MGFIVRKYNNSPSILEGRISFLEDMASENLSNIYQISSINKSIVEDIKILMSAVDILQKLAIKKI